MCRAMEEMRNSTEFKTMVNATIQIMKSFKVTTRDVLRVLQVPETEHPRYLAAIE